MTKEKKDSPISATPSKEEELIKEILKNPTTHPALILLIDPEIPDLKTKIEVSKRYLPDLEALAKSAGGTAKVLPDGRTIVFSSDTR